MSDDPRCDTGCPFYVKWNDMCGVCRCQPPKTRGKSSMARWPQVKSNDYCGSHPDRQPRGEGATTTLVGRETFPTESDMRRIVDALEKMASRAARGQS